MPALLQPSTDTLLHNPSFRSGGSNGGGSNGGGPPGSSTNDRSGGHEVGPGGSQGGGNRSGGQRVGIRHRQEASYICLRGTDEASALLGVRQSMATDLQLLFWECTYDGKYKS